MNVDTEHIAYRIIQTLKSGRILKTVRRICAVFIDLINTYILFRRNLHIPRLKYLKCRKRLMQLHTCQYFIFWKKSPLWKMIPWKIRSTWGWFRTCNWDLRSYNFIVIIHIFNRRFENTLNLSVFSRRAMVVHLFELQIVKIVDRGSFLFVVY